ncbi:hypothetical protein D3C87_2084860 [compost metagenome]
MKINNERVDCTTATSNFDKIKNDVLEEIEIEPFQVDVFKVDYHQSFIKNWLSKTNSEITFEQIWAIREQCIAFLS